MALTLAGESAAPLDEACGDGAAANSPAGPAAVATSGVAVAGTHSRVQRAQRTGRPGLIAVDGTS